MTKTVNITVGIIIAVLLTGIFVAFAYADARDVVLRDRGTSGRTIEPASPPPNPIPLPIPPPPSGGITSSTNGTVDTGNNTGGTVVTGDETVEVFEINIGPTNNTPPAFNDDDEPTNSPGAGAPCDPRSRADCPASSPARAR